MKIYDISLPISEASVVWPGDHSVQFKQLSSVEQGDNSTVTQVTMSAHTGTHVDAPKHFIAGAGSVDKLDLDMLVGPAWVADAGIAHALTAGVIKALNIPPGTKRVLFKTRNSELWAYGESTFYKDYVAITEDGAEWLLHQGVKLVGIDYLSVAPFSATAPTHRLLLKSEVILLEGLNLTGVRAGEYQLVCLPLKIKHGDGAPARTILMR